MFFLLYGKLKKECKYLSFIRQNDGFSSIGQPPLACSLPLVPIARFIAGLCSRARKQVGSSFSPVFGVFKSTFLSLLHSFSVWNWSDLWFGLHFSWIFYAFVLSFGFMEMGLIFGEFGSHGGSGFLWISSFARGMLRASNLCSSGFHCFLCVCVCVFCLYLSLEILDFYLGYCHWWFVVLENLVFKVNFLGKLFVFLEWWILWVFCRNPCERWKGSLLRWGCPKFWFSVMGLLSCSYCCKWFWLLNVDYDYLHSVFQWNEEFQIHVLAWSQDIWILKVVSKKTCWNVELC